MSNAYLCCTGQKSRIRQCKWSFSVSGNCWRKKKTLLWHKPTWLALLIYIRYKFRIVHSKNSWLSGSIFLSLDGPEPGQSGNFDHKQPLDGNSIILLMDKIESNSDKPLGMAKTHVNYRESLDVYHIKWFRILSHFIHQEYHWYHYLGIQLWSQASYMQWKLHNVRGPLVPNGAYPFRV